MKTLKFFLIGSLFAVCGCNEDVFNTGEPALDSGKKSAAVVKTVTVKVNGRVNAIPDPNLPQVTCLPENLGIILPGGGWSSGFTTMIGKFVQEESTYERVNCEFVMTDEGPAVYSECHVIIRGNNGDQMYLVNESWLDLATGKFTGHNVLTGGTGRFEGATGWMEMINAAIQLTAMEKATVKYLVGDMQEAPNLVEGPYNLIMCLGNSLALLPTIDDLKRTLRGVHALLARPGTFVAQILNFQEIRHSHFRFFPLKSGTLEKGDDVVFARFFEPFTDSTKAILVFTGFVKQEATWRTQVKTHEVLQLDQQLFESVLRDTGFEKPELFGGYDGSAFSPLESRNLIAVAKV